ncbi:2-C-methyl-D-erythritol 4-phosphate cytidylyltransferase [candidate division KSB1 bacterium]|nr:2-C-methyl-D-erythritol 4-phosphate cytidylyltransferase [candidate division KSB1 bacterium]NIR70258.1 2-C-methyl-D-erythritol 4-phosphate cytidylyltransferase [candidate division KSB1 bacterium]NIS26529.1 2-C-methyl-D-erythritol 4-phosphate cytidylyltransferase [candidate division KSB1 bacterium]NIT73291.1 2-C-methyl-D-erythritol 4-phosphate cytidylyltransferase [candidate division KSB1 bacterium]NIU23915.1 2-C-methyl-D-erythritol 4-phosphate cytidylyltransferase [candidate division KSB1 ba
MRISAVIVAAGTGRRIGGSIPKQFRELCGKPVLFYTLQKFENCDLIDDILIVTAESWLHFVSQEIVDRFCFEKVKKIISGGERRQDSVFAGIKALDGRPDLVAIHDAVRPFISIEKIRETVAACEKHGAAILAVPPKDTVKTERSGFVDRTLFRDSLWSVQTPQIFKLQILEAAFREAHQNGLLQTDDSALVERAGYSVKIVEGEYKNIKITEPIDLELAKLILRTEQE